MESPLLRVSGQIQASEDIIAVEAHMRSYLLSACPHEQAEDVCKDALT